MHVGIMLINKARVDVVKEINDDIKITGSVPNGKMLINKARVDVVKEINDGIKITGSVRNRLLS